MPRRFLPYMTREIYSEKDVFEYNAPGYRAPEIWGRLRTISFSKPLSNILLPWLKYMILIHNLGWKSLIYKILDREGYILPDLIKEYIVPMLDFDTGYEQISLKVARRYAEWEATSYDGASFLFQ